MPGGLLSDTLPARPLVPGGVGRATAPLWSYLSEQERKVRTEVPTFQLYPEIMISVPVAENRMSFSVSTVVVISIAVSVSINTLSRTSLINHFAVPRSQRASNKGTR